MEENFAVYDFRLTEEDMALISALATDYNRILDLHAPSEVERLYQIECKN